MGITTDTIPMWSHVRTKEIQYLGRSALDHQVYFRYVQASGRYVGRHQNLKGPVPEALECDLPLLLGDVPVERLGTLQEDKTSIITEVRHHDPMRYHSRLLHDKRMPRVNTFTNVRQRGASIVCFESPNYRNEMF